MSKGTKRYAFRLPEDLVDAVISTLHRRNDNSAEEPIDLSEFVRLALEEKVAHMDRGRKVEPFRRAIRKKGGVSDTPIAVEEVEDEST